MATDQVFVIVGAGEAGGSAAQVLREEGFDGLFGVQVGGDGGEEVSRDRD